MPQFVSFAINDGTLPTAVSVTYAPELLSSSQTVLVDRRLAARDQQPSINYSFDRATPARKTFKVKVAVAVPQTSIVGGSEVVVDTLRANVEFILPIGATLVNRRHLRAAAANALNHAYMKAGIEDLDPLY